MEAGGEEVEQLVPVEGDEDRLVVLSEEEVQLVGVIRDEADWAYGPQFLVRPHQPGDVPDGSLEDAGAPVLGKSLRFQCCLCLQTNLVAKERLDIGRGSAAFDSLKGEVDKDLEENQLGPSFMSLLRDFINAKIKPKDLPYEKKCVQLYQEAGLSKQLWSALSNCRKQKGVCKTTIVALALVLKLTLEETQTLMRSVGTTLSDSLKVDRIYARCIVHGARPWLVNEVLLEEGIPSSQWLPGWRVVKRKSKK